LGAEADALLGDGELEPEDEVDWEQAFRATRARRSAGEVSLGDTIGVLFEGYWLLAIGYWGLSTSD
jgi:hypothetical protein